MSGDAPWPQAWPERSALTKKRQNRPMAQDSSRPEFWDTRFRDGVTPWDAGGAPRQLAVWIQEKTSPLRVLIPGCGTGYEVRLFAEHGHDVLAIDFSDA